MKQVLPRLRNPTTRRIDFRFAVEAPFSLLLSLDIVRLRGRNFRALTVIDETAAGAGIGSAGMGAGSSQPESLDEDVLAVSCIDFEELISSSVEDVSDIVSS